VLAAQGRRQPAPSIPEALSGRSREPVGTAAD
jgi:hypothetical protein